MTIKARQLAFIFLAIFGLRETALAQIDTTKNDILGAFLIMPLEVPIINTTALNQQLNSYGFPSATHSKAAIGLGLQFHTNRFITTISFNKTTRTDSNRTHLTEVEYRSLSFNVGYSLTNRPHYSIYPYVGFKGCGLNYLYRDKIPSSVAFGNYFQTSLAYKNITNSRAHLDLGTGLSFQWFYLINLRGGYLLPLEKVTWKINNNKTSLATPPSIRYRYYFTLAFGLGNIVSDDEVRRQRRRHH